MAHKCAIHAGLVPQKLMECYAGEDEDEHRQTDCVGGVAYRHTHSSLGGPVVCMQ